MYGALEMIRPVSTSTLIDETAKRVREILLTGKLSEV